MGYTPQYLAGGWVGCDDRFIRFNSENLNGQGGRAAMPIWAYFFNKAAADANCGIDTKLTFIKPDIMNDDINIDYINGITPILGGEGEDLGTGTSTDYEVPKDIKPEELGAESQIILKEGEKPVDLKDKKPANLPATPTNKPGEKPAEKPKTVMPKKPGGGNN
jgi:penicillin-binding protein 1A